MSDLHFVRQDYFPEYHSALISRGVTNDEYDRFLSDYRYGLLDVLALLLSAFASLDVAREDFSEFIRLGLGTLAVASKDVGSADLVS